VGAEALACDRQAGEQVTDDNLDKLAQVIRRERDSLLSSWRQQVRQLPSARDLDIPVLTDHIPALLDELVAALQSGASQTVPETLIEGSPPAHDLQRFQEGFDIQEVVTDYSILRDCIHDLAATIGLNLQREPFRVMNRVLDQAIALAVGTYATQQTLEIQSAVKSISPLLRTIFGPPSTPFRWQQGCSSSHSATQARVLRRRRCWKRWGET